MKYKIVFDSVEYMIDNDLGCGLFKSIAEDCGDDIIEIKLEESHHNAFKVMHFDNFTIDMIDDTKYELFDVNVHRMNKQITKYIAKRYYKIYIDLDSKIQAKSKYFHDEFGYFDNKIYLAKLYNLLQIHVFYIKQIHFVYSGVTNYDYTGFDKEIPMLDSIDVHLLSAIKEIIDEDIMKAS